MTITGEHIRGLARLQKAIFRGTDVVPDVSLGPLISIYVDEHGAWTPDGTAVAWRLLQGVLDQYSAVTDAHGGRDADDLYSIANRVAALRSYWGITEPPAAAADAAHAISGPGVEGPTEGAVRSWQGVVTDHPDVLSWLNDRWDGLRQVDGRRRALTWPRPVWGGSARDWPRESDRTRLIAAVRQTPLPAGTSDDVIVQALREVVADELMGSYLASERLNRPYRLALQRVVLPWSTRQPDGYLVVPSPETDPPAGSVRRLVAVATEMLFADAAAGRLRARTLLRIDALRALTEIIDLATGATIFSRTEPAADTPATKRRQFTSADLATSPFLTYETEGPSGSHGLVADLYARATAIRGSERTSTQLQAQEYISLRRRVDWLHLDIAEAILLELADQSVHLDVARIPDARLVAQLGELIAASGHTPAGAAYMLLAQREQSLIATKRGQHADAIGGIRRALNNLSYLVERDFVDPRAAIEVAHQLCLAGAGAFLRLIEKQLRSSSHQLTNRALGSWCANALRLAEMTRDHLAELEGRGRGLATRRHEDGHISSVAWRVQTQIIVLRTQLAVHTATEAGLTSAPASRGAHGVSIELDAIRDTYVGIVTTRELSATDATEVVKLGVWLALLDRGLIPVVSRTANAMKNHFFLDTDPDTIVPGVHQLASIDLPAACSWLREIGHDAGILSYLAEGNPVSTLLDTRSGGLFSASREGGVLPPGRPDISGVSPQAKAPSR